MPLANSSYNLLNAFKLLQDLIKYIYCKVSIYNSLKACKGSVFSLLLPFSKTSEKLHSVEGPGKSLPSCVASPQLYIIVNGKPKELNVVWCTLINVDCVKAAIIKLKETKRVY